MGRSKPAPLKLVRGSPAVDGDRKTIAARDAIAMAAERLGGVDALVAWVRENEANERLFWGSLYPKLMPLQADGAGEEGEQLHSLTVTFVRPSG